MFTTILLLIAAFGAGLYVGAENPSVLATARADLHAAEAEATRVGTAIRKMENGLAQKFTAAPKA